MRKHGRRHRVDRHRVRDRVVVKGTEVDGHRERGDKIHQCHLGCGRASVNGLDLDLVKVDLPTRDRTSRSKLKILDRVFSSLRIHCGNRDKRKCRKRWRIFNRKVTQVSQSGCETLRCKSLFRKVDLVLLPSDRVRPKRRLMPV